MLLNRFGQADRFQQLDGEFCVGALVPGGGGSLQSRFNALYTVGSRWFDADLTQDPVAGLCPAMVDYRNPTRLLANPLGPSQCAAPVADAIFAGKKSLVFSGGQHYVSNEPLGWNHHHNGLGATNIMVLAPGVLGGTQIPASTVNGGAGASFYFSGNNPGMSIVNDAGAAAANGSAGPGEVVANVPRIWVRRFKVGASPVWSLLRGSVVKTSGGLINSLGTGNSAPFTVGKTAALTLGANMRLRAIYDFDYDLTPAQLQTVFDWVLADCAVVAT